MSATRTGAVTARAPDTRSRARRLARVDDERSRERWFVLVLLLCFAYGIGTAAVQSLTAPKYRVNAGLAGIPTSPLASLATTASLYGLLAVCAVVILLSLRQLPRGHYLRLAVLLAPWLYLVIRNRYALAPTPPNAFVYSLVVTAIWCLRPRLASLQWLGYLVGATALGSLVMGQFLPAKGIYQSAGGGEISPDKEIFSSGVLVGPLSNGNNLGQFFVMGIAAVLLVQRTGWRWLFFAATVVASLWAASRSCLAATALLLVVAFVLRGIPARLRGVLVLMGLSAMLLLVAALPLVTTEPGAFTNRGYIWRLLTTQWHENTYFGRGSGFFTRIAATSENLGGSVFHGHNQMMQDLVTGGWILAALMGLALAAGIRSSARLARLGYWFPAAYLIALLGACTLEVSFVLVDRFFALPVMVVPLAVIVLTPDADVPVPDKPGRRPRRATANARTQQARTAA